VNTSDTLPPHSNEAEQAVLGSILLEPICLDTAAQELGNAAASAFYDLRHAEIYKAMHRVMDNGGPLDLITLSQVLKDGGKLEAVGGLSYLAALADELPSSANVTYYLEIIINKFKLRALAAGFLTASHSALVDNAKPEDVAGQALAAIEALDHGGEVSGPKENARALIDALEAAFNLQGRHSGITTGFHSLDHYLSGLQLGEQTIIAARPSDGKTAIGLNLVDRVCLLDEIPTLVISAEMSRAALLRRLAAMRCCVAMDVMKNGNFTQGNSQSFTKLCAEMTKKPLYIYDSPGASCDTVAAIIRQHARRHGVKLVVVDYLQLIRSGSRHEKRTYEVGEVSGTLKAAAKRAGVALVTLAQLSREPDKDKGRRPRLSDLADSAQIERDADTVMMLHRPRDESGNRTAEAELIIAKQRDGETGMIPLEFEGRFMRFTEKVRRPIIEEDDL
jgi:replicative DNA helicase